MPISILLVEARGFEKFFRKAEIRLLLGQDFLRAVPKTILAIQNRSACQVSHVGDNVRWGVWLGRHIC